MSQFSDDFSVVAFPDLLEHFGEPVTRFAGGDPEYPVSLTGFVRIGLDDGSWSRDLTRGEEVQHMAKIDFPEGTVLTNRDTWLIREQTWQTVAIRSAVAGLVTVHIQRSDIETRNPRNGEGYRL